MFAERMDCLLKGSTLIWGPAGRVRVQARQRAVPWKGLAGLARLLLSPHVAGRVRSCRPPCTRSAFGGEVNHTPAATPHQGSAERQGSVSAPPRAVCRPHEWRRGVSLALGIFFYLFISRPGHFNTQNSFIKSKLNSFLSSPEHTKTLGHDEPDCSHPTRRPACTLRQPCTAPVYPGATLASSGLSLPWVSAGLSQAFCSLHHLKLSGPSEACSQFYLELLLSEVFSFLPNTPVDLSI